METFFKRVIKKKIDYVFKSYYVVWKPEKEGRG